MDPSGLYGTEVHLLLTYKWALQVGIDPDTAWEMAWANQAMDETATQPDSAWGWLSTGWKMHFQTSKYAQVGLNQCLQRKDVREFGRFLHILQDSFSHKGINPIEHAFLGNITRCNSGKMIS